MISSNPVMIDLSRAGIITFQIGGSKEYTLSFKSVQETFEFSVGKSVYQKFASDEMANLWEMMIGGEQFDFSSKSTRIRNPILAYARKAIAETFFSRDKIGPYGAREFHILIAVVKETISVNPLTNHHIFSDQAGAWLAFVLVKQLESYKGKIVGLPREIWP